MTRQQTDPRESRESHESHSLHSRDSRAVSIRFASHRQLEERAASRPPGYLLDLERIVVRRDAEGVWFDAALPAYAQLCAKYRASQSSIPNPPSPAWQEWREESGRWVAVGWLQPGYAADPPQFDPRPGEVQHTPAFPIEDFC